MNADDTAPSQTSSIQSRHGSEVNPSTSPAATPSITNAPSTVPGVFSHHES
jgi:hypothetical protein